MGRNNKNSNQDNRQAVEQTQTAALVWLGLSVCIALLLFIIYYWKKKDKKSRPNVNRLPTESINDAGVMRAETAGGARRRPRTARQRMMTRREDNDLPEYSDEDEQDDTTQVPWKDDEPSGKIGTKKMRKLQEKAEKKERREQEEQEREERKKQEELMAQERQKEEERMKLEEEQLEEEERLRKEEQERKDHEEYLLLKSAFTVEEEGEAGILSEQESQALLQEFIDFVKNKKVIMLEELASHFNLRVQEAIQRLEDLQAMGRLTGVMDDRGKFIYISEEELENFARYVKQRGRVGISDLAEASNSLITLKEGRLENDNKNQAITVS